MFQSISVVIDIFTPTPAGARRLGGPATLHSTVPRGARPPEGSQGSLRQLSALLSVVNQPETPKEPSLWLSLIGFVTLLPKPS